MLDIDLVLDGTNAHRADVADEAELLVGAARSHRGEELVELVLNSKDCFGEDVEAHYLLLHLR
jgi:hypothetical protein